MKNYVLLTLLIMLTTSCTHNKRTSEENQKNSEVHKKSDSIAITFKPDIKINTISVLDTKNVENYLGEDIMKRLDNFPIQKTSVLSKDAKQRLTVYFHPGSTINEFSEFKIEAADQKETSDVLVNDKEFITESNIKLGMTLQQLKSIKGDPQVSDVKNDTLTNLHYKIDDLKNSDFLKKYNMPIYYAHYTFKENRLITFKFGFEYP